MPGIGIVNNPRSKKNRKSPENMKFMGYLLGNKAKSKETYSALELEDVAREFKNEQIDILAINGGDGSNHFTLTTFLRVYGDTPLPKVALLRGGTLNTISNACGIKGSPQWLLFNLVEKYHADRPFVTVHRDLLRIGDMYGFIFGNGVVADFLETYYEYPEVSPWVGFKTLARGVGSAVVRGELARKWFHGVRGRIEVDGIELPYPWVGSAFGSTIHELGLGFKPFFRCEERPHAFHFLCLTGSPVSILPSLPWVWFGRPINPEAAFEAVAERVEIEAEEPFAYTIDGDLHHATDGRLSLSAGPRVELIVR